jgi:hypothetical protein
MAYLRVKELLNKRKLTFEDLKQYPELEDLPLEQYADCPLKITKDNAVVLRRAAKILKVNPLELLRTIDENYHPGVADKLPEDMTVGEWVATRGVSVEEAAMLSDRHLISPGEVFCDLFPDYPGCKES